MDAVRCVRVALLVLAVCAAAAVAVDRGKFKTCAQSGFCRRNREYAQAEGDGAYAVVEGSAVHSEMRSTFSVADRRQPEALFVLDISHVGEGVVRVQLYPSEGPRPYSPEDALSEGALPTPFQGESAGGRVFGVVEVQHDPLLLSFYSGDELVMMANGRQLLNMELGPSGVVLTGEGEEGEAEAEAAASPYRVMPAIEVGAESFGSHKDTKPRGPTSVSLDFTFPRSQHLYGIPSHASALRLKSTRDTDPFRLYNLDVFEYELDETMALYGSIPFMLSHRKRTSGTGSITSGVFWLNAAETWVDVDYSPSDAQTHWFSESGMVDFFVTLGPHPKHVLAQYARITGRAELPPAFAIAYHQCRWNYKDEADVAEVDRQMDEHNLPYDVIWLDIEHTDGKRYFTWDKNKFGSPEEMQANIASKGRKMVTIVDPHIKNDKNYYIHSEASAKGLYVKNKDGESDYEGWCWPGSSSYLDFSNADVRHWWGDQFGYSQYKGSSEALFTWNDMNEPSVFNGPEVTMQKDLVHAGGVEHRDLHNMFGMYVHMATADGLVRRNADRNTRPFVLSRAFFAGSQRYGAVWTGDNTATWEHMRASMPMLLSMGVTGLPFVGADVGGFFNNPDSELLARWYQLGAYQPFFRAHAHLDTKRREPYLFDERTTGVIRNALRSRYALLPYWYTLFYEAYTTGVPMMRPLWLEYADDADTFAVEDEYLVGTDLLVAPALKAGASEVTVFLPGSERWFDVETHEALDVRGYTKVAAPFEKIPVFQRGGSIVPKKLRPRRSSSQMLHDPVILVVAVGKDGTASGRLYVDDGASFNHKNGEYALMEFSFANGELRSAPSHSAFDTSSTVERVLILGLDGSYSGAVVRDGAAERTVSVVRDATNALVVRKPDVSVVSAWSIKLQ